METKLQRAREAIESPAKAQVWKGYHDFQSLYMQGLLDGDKKLQISALEGLIDASRTLGLDPTRYRNALRTLQPKRAVAKKASTPKKSVAPSKKLGRRVTPKLPETVSKKRRRLTASKVVGENLVLRFSSPIPKEGVRRFVLKKRTYNLYVFDITPATVPFSIKRIKGDGFKEIRIAQFDPSKVRVVVETRARYRPDFEMKGSEIRIGLPPIKTAVAKKAKPKTATSQKPAAPKPPVKTAAKKKKKPKKSVETSGTKSVAVPSVGHSLLRRYTVVIDPGHGGKDAGAVGYMRKREKDAVLAVAKELKRVLKSRGFNVYLTRERDIFIPLKRRTRYANRKQADFFISIHANAAAKRSQWHKSRGIETYFLSRARTSRAKRVAAIENSAEIKNVDRYTKEAYLSVLSREKIIESNKLAIDLQRQMLTAVRSHYKDVVDNGVREGPFWVLVGAQMPAVLIEIGYITNPTEARRLFSKRYQKLLAEGIANGIESYIYHNR